MPLVYESAPTPLVRGPQTKGKLSMNARKLDFMAVALPLALALVFAGAGCGKSGGSSAGSDKGVAAEKTTTPKTEPEAKPEAKPAPETKEKIKLTVNDFGVFGYKPLYAE